MDSVEAGAASTARTHNGQQIMITDILFTVENHLAKITLNRPKALNALTDDMFLQMRAHLEKWENDQSIKAVLIRSNSEKAFCAGGDIKAVYENKNVSPEKSVQYFELEYAINKMIYHFKKPYIALTHGITMGGGVGVSIHGSHCVAADNLRWAMPETAIGFFPDVGVSYYLSRLPNHVGLYLALTGKNVDVYDAFKLNLIKYCVKYSDFDALEKKLIEFNFHSSDFDSVSNIIHLFHFQPEEKNGLDIKKIAHYFSFDSVEKIMDALEKEPSDWAIETAAQLLQCSPTSLKVTFEQLKKAACQTGDKIITVDLHIAKNMLKQSDFYEGVRALVVDKDKNPKWNPVDLTHVTEAEVNRYLCE